MDNDVEATLSRGEQAIAEMKEAGGYDEMTERRGPEALIAYKDELEDRLRPTIDEAAAARMVERYGEDALSAYGAFRERWWRDRIALRA